MISIIVCSRSKADYDAFERNARETVGIEAEFIRIDNSEGKYSIFEAYNLGMDQARGDLLCFAHEDICFHTPNWGKRCESHFRKHPSLGLLGVAGGTIFPKGCDWRAIGEGGQCDFLQRFATLEQHPRTFTAYIRNKTHKKLTEVVAIDGLWMVMRSSLSGAVRFDTETFHSFHLYDTDLSMQVRKAGSKVAVCKDILIEHFSTGTFAQEYFDVLEVCLRKWDSFLPVMLRPLKPDTPPMDVVMKEYKADRLEEADLRRKIREGSLDELTQEQKDLIRPNVRLFHHVWEKQSPTMEASYKEIDKSFDAGLITLEEANYFRRKTFLYHTILKPLVKKKMAL